MAYVEDLTALEGLRLWNIIISLLFGLYAFGKFREGDTEEGIAALGAAIFSLMISWAADYYKCVWIGGALIVLAIIMLATPLNEAPLPQITAYTGAALLLSAIMLYFAPISVFDSFNGFIIACCLLAVVIFIDTALDRYEWYEAVLVFGLTIVIAVIAIKTGGFDHVWYGLIMMYGAIVLALFGFYTQIIDPVFFGGSLLYLDDYIGEGIYNNGGMHPLLWGVLGLVAFIVYMILRWREK